jgi:hypothetical protein
MARQARFGARTARMVMGVALALGLSGCTWLYGPAVPLPEDVEEAVEKPAIGARALLRMNNVDLELASWQPALQASLDSLRPPLAPAAGSALAAALRRAYGVQRLYDRMATSVALGWDPDAAREIFAFYDSWLGNRVLRAQAGRRSRSTLTRFERFNASFERSRHSPRRIALFERIDRALLTSQTAVWLNRAYLDSALAAVGEGVPAASVEPVRELRARYAAEEASLYPLGAEQVLRWNLFAFAWLTESDLERYAEFAESAPAQWWVVTTARGYRAAVSGAGEDLFQALRPRAAN